jgi:hypothetical protein
MPHMPPAWSDLISGLLLLADHQFNSISPLHCEHDELMIMSDPSQFTAEQIAKLKAWGFHATESGDAFYSYRFGSA